jgi:hypothetical protein
LVAHQTVRLHDRPVASVSIQVLLGQIDDLPNFLVVKEPSSLDTAHISTEAMELKDSALQRIWQMNSLSPLRHLIVLQCP